MTEQCKEKIYANFITHQCERKATKEGYCWQHHPDAVKKRQEESDKLAEEKWQNSKFMQLQRANKKIKELKAKIAELETSLEFSQEYLARVESEVLWSRMETVESIKRNLNEQPKELSDDD